MENAPKPQQTRDTSRPAGPELQSPWSLGSSIHPSVRKAESLGSLQEGPLPPAYLGLPSPSLDKQKATAADGPAGLSSRHTHTSSLWLHCQGWAQQRKTKGAWPQDTGPLFFLLQEKPQPGAEGASVQVETGEAEPRGGWLGVALKKRLFSGQASCYPNLTTRLQS